MTEPKPGTLYVCGTPIGNLLDMSERLKKTLADVDIVACEDTRRTLKILSHLDLKKPVVSLHRHAEKGRSGALVDALLSGKSAAFVSDAGMPGISDPGSYLVSVARESGIDVTVVPGPCAVTSALALSGFPANAFNFFGFPPRKASQRRKFFGERLKPCETAVFFESPYRLLKSLEDLRAVFPDCAICLCHEMTKIHESVFFGTVEEALAEFSGKDILGEWVIVVRVAEKEEAAL